MANQRKSDNTETIYACTVTKLNIEKSVSDKTHLLPPCLGTPSCWNRSYQVFQVRGNRVYITRQTVALSESTIEQLPQEEQLKAHQQLLP